MKTIEISHNFGGVQALKNVSINCEPGTITGLVGPNGSGKTTLVNVLTGVIPLKQGKIFEGGNFARTFQDEKLWANLTVTETLLLTQSKETWWRALVHLTTKRELEEVAAVAERLGLSGHLNTQIRDLSYGQRKLVEIARALAVKDKEVIYFDEPFAGLSSSSTVLVERLIRTEKAEQKSILIIEHDMEIIRNLCDLVFVLDAGEVIATGTPAQCLADKRVKEAYLGI